MIEIFRLAEDQAKLSSYRAAQNEDQAVQLELAIELTKPKNKYTEWHDLIATPFRYSPPLKIARFRAEFARNVFYGSVNHQVTYYEYSYHFMMERRHLKIKTETGQRTLFSVNADDRYAVYLHQHPHCKKITDKNDYTASHHFVETNVDVSFIIYPSCRDPQKRDNAAIFDINVFEKNINNEIPVKYFYDNKKQVISWLYQGLRVSWKQVS